MTRQTTQTEALRLSRVLGKYPLRELQLVSWFNKKTNGCPFLITNGNIHK